MDEMESTSSSPPSFFVRAQGTELVLFDEEFRFVGADAFWLLEAAESLGVVFLLDGGVE